MMPYAAPIDSRFITTAFSGTSRLRKTHMRSRKDTTSTPPMIHTSLAPR